MKKLSKMGVILPITLMAPISLVVSCSGNNDNDSNVLDEDLKLSFNFMQKVMSKNDQAYGLVPDRYFVDNPDLMSSYHQSNDALGWLLSSFVIGSERGYITKKDALIKTKKVVKTIINLPNWEGIPVHFSNRDGSKRNGSEFSTATAMLIFGGLITAESYFDDQELTSLTKLFIDRIEWNNWVINGDNMFFKMSYQSDVGDYGGKGYHGIWNMSAEQQILYVLYASSSKTSSENSKNLYNSFNRRKTGFTNYISEPGGSLFTYQFSHSYIDFKNIDTGDGVDWYENTSKAIEQDRKVSNDLLISMKNINDKHYWGLSANDAANGKYRVVGTNNTNEFDGWLSPWGQIGSISYDAEAKTDIEYVKKMIPQSWNKKYGFLDGYSPKLKYGSDTILPLDKGMEMVAIENYTNSTIWNLFKDSTFVKNAMQKLNWTEK